MKRYTALIFLLLFIFHIIDIIYTAYKDHTTDIFSIVIVTAIILLFGIEFLKRRNS